MARILIIEDDEPLRALLKHMLEAAGHTVTQAETSRAVLQILRQAPPDVVLTDIIMPDLDGLELIMMIRKEMPKMPVIAMSGAMTNASLYLRLAKKLGARRTLQKPFVPEQLFAAVREVLGRV
ncbi:MAG: response regulator receiver domain [Lacunisphaera sp.]|nr:response regulator receiver domain [Lacunisphaera sp.]